MRDTFALIVKSLRSFSDLKDIKLTVDPIVIYDVYGPPVFEDWIAEDSDGRSAFVRTLPTATDDKQFIVSINRGVHPILRPNFRKNIDAAFHRGPSITFPTGRADISPVATAARRAFLKQPEAEKATALLMAFESAIPKRRTEAAPYRYVCYCYPRIGVEVELGSPPKQGYIDVEEGFFVPIKESGTTKSETPCPTSFIATLPEAGVPIQINPATPEFKLPGLTIMGQEKANWCAAASCAMVLTFWGIKVTQAAIAQAMHIPTDPDGGGAELDAQIDGWRAVAGDKLVITPDTNPTAAACLNEIANGRPVKHGRVGHARVVFGWKKDGGDVCFLMADSLPVGQGSEPYYENPLVVFPKNFILAKRKA